MATRVGHRTSPTACRIVELEAGSGQRGHGDAVRSFAVLAAVGSRDAHDAGSLRRQPRGRRRLGRAQRAPAGDGDRRARIESMRAEADGRAGARRASTTSGAWADIAPAAAAGDRAARRPVVVAIASASELSDAVQPLPDAGRPGAVGDDAGARAGVAGADAAGGRRRRGDRGVRGARRAGDVHRAGAERRAGRGARAAVGVHRADYARTEPRSREDVATRLADAIGEFVAAVGGSPARHRPGLHLRRPAGAAQHDARR